MACALPGVAVEHLAAAPQQQFEQGEFLGGEVNARAGPQHLVPQQVDFEVADANLLGFARFAAPEQPADARKQL